MEALLAVGHPVRETGVAETGAVDAADEGVAPADAAALIPLK